MALMKCIPYFKKLILKEFSKTLIFYTSMESILISPAKEPGIDNMWDGHHIMLNFKENAWLSTKHLLILAKPIISVLAAQAATKLVQIFLSKMKLTIRHYFFVSKNLNIFSKN